MVKAARSRSQMVEARLRSAIIRGDISLGESLPEDVLAEAFSVSRTPVRQALQRLEVQGLVELRPKAVTKVFQPTPEQIEELSDLRSTIENRAAELAFQRARKTVVSELSAVLSDMEDSIQSDDMTCYGEADTRFHEVFYRHSGNRYIQSVYELNLAQVAALRTNLASYSSNEPQRSFKEHLQIVELFEENEFQRLSTLLHQHIMRTSENYANALEAIYRKSGASRVDELKEALNL